MFLIVEKDAIDFHGHACLKNTMLFHARNAKPTTLFEVSAPTVDNILLLQIWSKNEGLVQLFLVIQVRNGC